MCNFSLGMVTGTLIGASLILAVHPMNKREMRRACHRAGRMMNKFNHTIRDFT